MTRTTADVVVVGAGVVGSSTALELAKSGSRVVVVDKAGGPGHGSTSASSAIIRFNYSTRAGVAAAWESQHCWVDWPEHLQFHDGAGMASFQRTGFVVLDVPVAPMDRVIPLFDHVGVPYEVWDARTLETRVSGIDTGRYWPPKPVHDDDFFADAEGELGALYTPDGGFVDDPQLAAHNLAFAAQSRGAEFTFHRAVVEVNRGHGRIAGVTLSDGTRIDSSVVVNAAGPWSAHVNRLASVGAEFTVTVRPMRQEVHQVPGPRGWAAEGDWPPTIVDMDLGTYLRPAPHGRLLVGGTEPECDPLEWVDDPDVANVNPTATRFQTQVTRAARRLPGLGVPNATSGIAGVYDVSDDWTPIYDRTDLDGFYVAIGTSGNQFKNAPLVGRFMAVLIDGVENGRDHDRDPLTYRCEHTGQDIDLSAFSRKRPINKHSTGTVMG